MSRSDIEATQAAAAALSLLWAEATVVIALRLWLLACGMAPPREQHRMFEEKPMAFSRAAFDAWAAANEAAWRRPFDPLAAALAGTAAWTDALTRKATSNRRRLVRGLFVD